MNTDKFDALFTTSDENEYLELLKELKSELKIRLISMKSIAEETESENSELSVVFNGKRSLLSPKITDKGAMPIINILKKAIELLANSKEPDERIKKQKEKQKMMDLPDKLPKGIAQAIADELKIPINTVYSGLKGRGSLSKTQEIKTEFQRLMADAEGGKTLEQKRFVKEATELLKRIKVGFTGIYRNVIKECAKEFDYSEDIVSKTINLQYYYFSSPERAWKILNKIKELVEKKESEA